MSWDVESASDPLPQPKSRARTWLVPAAVAVGLVTASIVVMVARSNPARTVSEARAEIATVLLRVSPRSGGLDGGPIGPWWVSAAEGDPDTGEFRDFQLRSGSLHVAAKHARLLIEPDSSGAATFSFKLSGVIIMSMPEDDADEAALLQVDFFTLGPVPLRGRIVADDPMVRTGIARAD